MILTLVSCINCENLCSISNDVITTDARLINLLDCKTGMDLYCNNVIYSGTRSADDDILSDNIMCYNFWNYLCDSISYDNAFKLRGPMNNQAYAIILKLSAYICQNTMLKHDFHNYIEHFNVFPIPDIISRPCKWRKKSSQNKQPVLKKLSNCLFRGGEIPKTDDKSSNFTHGSKYFEGSFLSEYSCFTLKDRQICPISSIECIVPMTYELMNILPKKAVLSLKTPIDLITCIPPNKLLNKLTKINSVCISIDF